MSTVRMLKGSLLTAKPVTSYLVYEKCLKSREVEERCSDDLPPGGRWWFDLYISSLIDRMYGLGRPVGIVYAY